MASLDQIRLRMSSQGHLFLFFVFAFLTRMGTQYDFSKYVDTFMAASSTIAVAYSLNIRQVRTCPHACFLPFTSSAFITLPFA
jgi:hypothetical protein